MAYQPMYELWRTKVDDAVFDVLLDLGHAESYPLSGHPWFFGVRIPMTNADKEGLPSEEEERRLDVVENRIRELARARDAIYVGRRTGQRNRDLMMYMPANPRGIEDRIRSSIGAEILFISRADPDWQGYAQLIPGAKEWRSIEDERIIQGLLALGSDAQAVHEIVHRVETDSSKGGQVLKRFMTKLELEDILVEGEGDLFTVMGIQRTTLDSEKILRASWNLENQAPRVRGTYLGWDAEPVMGEIEDLDIGLSDDALLEALFAKMSGGEE